jgi:hypothetical protein
VQPQVQQQPVHQTQNEQQPSMQIQNVSRTIQLFTYPKSTGHPTTGNKHLNTGYVNWIMVIKWFIAIKLSGPVNKLSFNYRTI